MVESLVRVVAPHFVAGFVMRDGVCVEAAPILKRQMLGRSRAEIARVIRAQRWQVEIVSWEET